MSDNHISCNREIKQLKARIAELEAENRWIPVEEDLPEERPDTVPWRTEDVEVVVAGTIDIAYLSTRQQVWYYRGGCGRPQSITHWRKIRIPTLPEKETDNEIQ